MLSLAALFAFGLGAVQDPAPDACLVALDAGLRITESEYRDFLRTEIGGARLDELVFDRLLERESGRLDATRIDPELHALLVDPEAEVDRRIAAAIAGEAAGDRKVWLGKIHARGRTLDEERTILRRAVLRETRTTALVRARRRPDAAALRRSFEELFGKDGLTIVARHRLVSFREVAASLPSGEGPDREAQVQRLARERAVALSAQARERGGPEALGFEALREGYGQVFGADFEDAVRALPPGKISDPIAGRTGFHVVIVDERKVTRREDVEDEVQRSFHTAPPTLGEVRRLREDLFSASGADRALRDRLSR
ncbi:MAG: hypothetical protein U1F36_08985 [Planctomycetota bacterium]